MVLLSRWCPRMSRALQILLRKLDEVQMVAMPSGSVASLLSTAYTARYIPVCQAPDWLLVGVTPECQGKWLCLSSQKHRCLRLHQIAAIEGRPYPCSLVMPAGL